MPGRIVRRVAKGPLGMWTEVHFPNGDRVMVSMARDEIKVFKLSSRWGTLFGKETLATIDVKTMMALARASADKVRAELHAKDVDVNVPSGDGYEEVLDSTTALISMWDSAAEVRAFDFAGVMAAATRKSDGV